MKSWQPLQLDSVLQSESNIQNVLDLDSSFPCTKSDVVAWWTTLGLRLGSSWTSYELQLGRSWTSRKAYKVYFHMNLDSCQYLLRGGCNR
jgi:hypothetical protein